MTNLKALRESKGVSQQTVADYLGITRQAYGNYETGKRQADYAALLRLAAFFGVSVDALLQPDPPAQTKELAFDDFPYAMYEEGKQMTEENKQKFLEMAKFFKQQQEKEKGSP